MLGVFQISSIVTSLSDQITSYLPRMRDGRDHQPTTEQEAFENAWRDYWSQVQEWLDGVANNYGPEFSLKLSPNYYGRMDDIDNANLTIKLLWFEHSFYIRSNAEEGESHPDFHQVEISSGEDNFWNLDEENLWKLAFFELFQQQDRERVVRGANWTKPADERASCFLGPDDGICLNCQRRIRRHFGGTEYRCFPNTLAEAKASVWIHKAGEEPRKIGEYENVTFKTTPEGPGHQLTERPVVEYTPGVTGPYQITFNVKTAAEDDYLPMRVGPEVGEGCATGCKPFTDGWRHHKTCPRVSPPKDVLPISAFNHLCYGPDCSNSKCAMTWRNALVLTHRR